MQSEEGAGCNTKSIEGVCLCPLEGIIHTISRKWTLQIVTMIGNHGSLRYSEIQTMCSGISPTVLSSRLRELEDESIISREAFAEIPPPENIDNAPYDLGLQPKLLSLLRVNHHSPNRSFLDLQNHWQNTV
ncbi:MAG: winged helix-turn-helix transcriptional regulator [Candidatus Thorarchaeota archaeon]